MWNPIIGQKGQMAATKPGYGRFRVPEGAVVVLRAKVGGKDPRVAHRCVRCATSVLPPDPVYDDSVPSDG
jgi:hypothetical protein